MRKFGYGLDARGYFNDLYGKSLFTQVERYNRAVGKFRRQFGYGGCCLASASGRVELLGNHTDHNGGRVVGCAVDRDIIAAFRPTDNGVIRIRSDKHAEIAFNVAALGNAKGGAGLAQGVVEYLLQAGYAVGGFDAYTHSALPSGAGVSSSAAYETLIATIINNAYNGGKIPLSVMARAGQYAENKYLNKPCGLLDQGSSLAGGISAFDFADGFAYDVIPADNLKIKFALVDTGKSHSDLSHMYASIPAEMFSVARCLGKSRLVEADADEFFASETDLRSKLGDRPVNRAKHFFQENERVDRLVAALSSGNTREIIRLVKQSGDSSMHLLENCSADENDTAIRDAVEYARSCGAGVGARVHGGGFAGTVLCVADESDFPSLYQALCGKYGQGAVLPMRVRSSGALVL